MAKIAVLGYGTVGSGVVEVIRTNHDSIAKKAGDPIDIKYVLDLRDFPGDPVEEVLVHDFDTILQDPEVDIVVETMGGLTPAYEFSKAALSAGKSVCTSNKELVAAHGPELLALAKERDINYLFEASCGGGIPIIRPLNSSLTADEIDEITGILNGTTNYILTKMAQDGSEFEDALAEAQQLGYAERDPSADIEGWDPCRKIAILSSLAYGRSVNYEDIYTEGITKITATDIKYANALGARIKLLATSRKTQEGFYAMVAPMLLFSDDPLYSVQDVFNAIFVHGNVLGDAMFYGSGAGKLPTASAVVADVVDCAKHLHRNIMMNWSSKPLALADIGEVQSRFFVRVSNDAEEQVAERFGEGKRIGGTDDKTATAQTVEQIRLDDVYGEFAFFTEEMTEAEFAEKIRDLPVISRIRVRM